MLRFSTPDAHIVECFQHDDTLHRGAIRQRRLLFLHRRRPPRDVLRVCVADALKAPLSMFVECRARHVIRDILIAP